MVSAYREGWQAFRHTPVHEHLLWLMRRIVHHGHERGKDASAHLGEVAEAFRDCQAVQARVVERVGLRLLGVGTDLTGLLVRLAGEYKALAIKMLAADRLAKGLAKSDGDDVPTHYENRLTADIGGAVGANADDIRRAERDRHAKDRYQRISGAAARAAASRCQELFDVEAMLGAFVAEVNGFNEDSPKESLPAIFLQWASEHMALKHMVFDEDTCTRVEVEPLLALCVFEVLFTGGLRCAATEEYRGVAMREVFGAALEAGQARMDDEADEDSEDEELVHEIAIAAMAAAAPPDHPLRRPRGPAAVPRASRAASRKAVSRKRAGSRTAASRKAACRQHRRADSRRAASRKARPAKVRL